MCLYEYSHKSKDYIISKYLYKLYILVVQIEC